MYSATTHIASYCIVFECVIINEIYWNLINIEVKDKAESIIRPQVRFSYYCCYYLDIETIAPLAKAEVETKLEWTIVHVRIFFLFFIFIHFLAPKT